MILGVDLAARYSAWCKMSGGEVVAQGDSFNVSQAVFLDALVMQSAGCSLVVVEDLPYKLPFAMTVKKVCRLQGRIVERFVTIGRSDVLVFVSPGRWQQDMKVWRQGPEGAALVAAGLGYEPPSVEALKERIVAAEMPRKTPKMPLARKIASDYVDAFLIAAWAEQFYDPESVDKSVQRPEV